MKNHNKTILQGILLYTVLGAMVALALLIVATGGGCSSAPHRIAGAAVDIRQNAESSRERFISLEVPEGVQEQDEIITLTEEVIQQLPAIQEKPNEWLNTVQYVAIGVAVIGVIVLIWQLGVGHLFRSLFSWVPRRKQSVAKLLDEAIAAKDYYAVREAVAALRVSDSEIDTAFRKRHNDSGKS